MSLSLRPIPFSVAQQFFADFQKKSKCLELPPEGAEYLGAYDGERLVGYMVVCGYGDGVAEINQGYLRTEGRNKGYGQRFVRLLEEVAKKNGFKRMDFVAQRSLKAYVKYAESMGYRPTKVIFSKEF